MYAIKVVHTKRGLCRKTVRWAEKLGDTWDMIPRLANIIFNKSNGIAKTKVQAGKLLEEVQEALGCECKVVKVILTEMRMK